MKRLLFVFMVMIGGLSNSAMGQAANDTLKNWEKGGMGSLTFNQVGLFNWAAGGQSNITLIGNLNLFAHRTWEKSKWENTLDLAYGFIKNDFIFNPDARIAKAEDKIDFNSKYGRKAWSDKVYYSGLLNFRSQFDFGRDVPSNPSYISRFMSPGYLIFALGLDYKPNDDLAIFISPASGKATFVTDDSLASVSAFGVNQLREDGTFFPGSNVNSRVEVGATFRAKYKRDIMENVGLETQIELFSNYIDRPQNIDIRWTNGIVAKVNKYITVNLFTDMIYDHDIDIGRRRPDGTPDYSQNSTPLFIDNPNSNNPNDLITLNIENDPAQNTFWPAPTYDPINPQNNTEEDVVQVQKKGPVVQFKEVFGAGLTYKF